MIRPDLAQKPVKRHFCAHTIVDRGDPCPSRASRWASAQVTRGTARPGTGCTCPSACLFPNPCPNCACTRPGASHPGPKRNARRFYSPQDQSQIHPLFLLIDRASGQVLARVRGTLNHVEVEAEKFARAQGCELADLRS